ncbi:CopG domain protein DNA-binding domain protein [Nakamurella multipartita DSM 44233]|uniref:CopG domain protein DNA-binding domain protein n=2 Tax=Nakamurella TaxID=53460 RepID=C8XI73_NAKMY|nr:CopG domain protein DNA-binding domain protein [Nakamurella multipartita DSM 44233]
MSQKTLAIRLDDDLHARITILARLGGQSVTDAIRDALRAHVDVLAADPTIAAKAAALREQIARDADEQQAAIQALFGTPQPPKTGRPSGSK